MDSHFHRKRFPWRRYALDDRERKKDESEDEVEEEVSKKQLNESLALYDLNYLEPEKPNGGASQGSSAPSVYEVDTDPEEPPEVVKKKEEKPKIFAEKSFYLHPNLKEVDMIKIEDAIPDNGGAVVTNLHDADFVISEVALTTADKGQVVKARWVFECLEMKCLIPTKRYLF